LEIKFCLEELKAHKIKAQIRSLGYLIGGENDFRYQKEFLILIAPNRCIITIVFLLK